MRSRGIAPPMFTINNVITMDKVACTGNGGLKNDTFLFGISFL